VLIGFGVLVVIGALTGNKNTADQAASTTSSTEGSAQDSTAPTNTTPAAPSCSDDWSACKDNADIVNNSTMAMIKAKTACKDAVAQRAKYGDPKWCSGWLCEDFDKFRNGVDAPTSGLITIVDDKVQLQNGFGAWPHVSVYCTYDLKTNEVENLDVNEND
jgi:hypothetical protein